MLRHVLNYRTWKCFRNCLVSIVSFGDPHIRIEYPYHQPFGPTGELEYGQDYFLNGWCVVLGQVKFHNIPPTSPKSQLEDNNFGAEVMVWFHHEWWRVAVERCHTALIPSWCVGWYDAATGNPWVYMPQVIFIYWHNPISMFAWSIPHRENYRPPLCQF